MYFNKVTLLITHYNRSLSLERLLLSFNKLNCHFEDIVVSDDGSKPEHLSYLLKLQERFTFRLVTTPVNKGLGNNINKGQDAVRTPYTLYVQEDFVPKPLFKLKLYEALTCLNDDSALDMVRFYAYFNYPHLKPFKYGFSEMMFSAMPWYLGYRKFYYYSDHPHLRRSNFFQKFGRYHEGLKVERTEYRMMFSFLQNKGKALFYDNFQELFDQVNSTYEPSTVKRNKWRESYNPVVYLMREFYRYIRFNFDLHFTPSTNTKQPDFFEEYQLIEGEETALSRTEMANVLENLLSNRTFDSNLTYK